MTASRSVSTSAELVIAARGTAPGCCWGPLRRNDVALSPSEATGSILLAERARPEDVDRILAAAGTLTLGGALLSHINLLSREFGKPSLALFPESRAELLPAGGPELLELPAPPGARERPLRLREGDIVLLDGDRGILRIPGGGDPSAREAIRRLHRLIAGYAADPADPLPLRRLAASAEELSPDVLGLLVEAALLCRAVPPGGPAKRFVAALLDSPHRSEASAALQRIRDLVLERARERFVSLRRELVRIENTDELDRRRIAWRSRIAREREILSDLGASPGTLSRMLDEMETEVASRARALRSALSAELEEALRLSPEETGSALHRLGRLLRRAREAGADPGLVKRLGDRVSGPLASERRRMGRVRTVGLNEEAAAERSVVGGKALGLMRFASRLPRDCRIPHGFVVTTSAYRVHLLGEVGEKIDRAIERGGSEAEISRLARAAILGSPLPDEVAEAVARAHAEFGDRRLAVRSSAILEDGPESSLAGQFDTYLGVRGLDELLDRVRWTWASLWNAPALRLLAGSGRSPLTAGMGVLVQELVATRSAGVMFTRDPAGRPDMVLINAAWGLGEGVSRGEVSGDLFWVHRERGEISAVQPGHACRQIVADPERRGTLAVELPARLRGRPCLDEPRLERLAELARRIDEIEARAMDVEFGFDEEGGLLLFQLRRAPTSGEAPA
jgi:pyruvate,water dikinase